MDRALAVNSSGKSRDIPGPGGSFFDFGSLFMNKTVRSSPSGDGSQQAGSNAAIESFWRCIFVELLPFLWSIGVPGGPRGVPGGSHGRARGSQARLWGS